MTGSADIDRTLERSARPAWQEVSCDSLSGHGGGKAGPVVISPHVIPVPLAGEPGVPIWFAAVVAPTARELVTPAQVSSGMPQRRHGLQQHQQRIVHEALNGLISEGLDMNRSLPLLVVRKHISCDAHNLRASTTPSRLRPPPGELKPALCPCLARTDDGSQPAAGAGISPGVTRESEIHSLTVATFGESGVELHCGNRKRNVAILLRPQPIELLRAARRQQGD